MHGDRRFNVRVYGLWIENGRVLVSEEEIAGNTYVKFPGGGLDYGEGLIDSLKREWVEELDMQIEVREHFYTTDYFQKSVFDDTQIISIYYLIQPTHPDIYIMNRNENERCYWMKVEDITDSSFTLPIEQKVGMMLKERFA